MSVGAGCGPHPSALRRVHPLPRTDVGEGAHGNGSAGRRLRRMPRLWAPPRRSPLPSRPEAKRNRENGSPVHFGRCRAGGEAPSPRPSPPLSREKGRPQRAGGVRRRSGRPLGASLRSYREAFSRCCGDFSRSTNRRCTNLGIRLEPSAPATLPQSVLGEGGPVVPARVGAAPGSAAHSGTRTPVQVKSPRLFWGDFPQSLRRLQSLSSTRRAPIIPHGPSAPSVAVTRLLLIAVASAIRGGEGRRQSCLATLSTSRQGRGFLAW
jgi:hypothetical protein